jgi:hypothetical protein
MHNVHPLNGFIYYSTAQKLQRGAFKAMRKGQIDLLGQLVKQLPFLPTPAHAPASESGNNNRCRVALKQPYLSNPRTSSDSSSVISVLAVSPDNQVKELAADSLSIQWAAALLQDIYEFIVSYHQKHGVKCPVKIPVFWFVTSGLAMTNVPGAEPSNKEVFLIEELIQSDGPWKKYINNNSTRPCHFSDHDNRRRSEFLAFCQHVQYWRTDGLVFTSDFQGEWHMF